MFVANVYNVMVVSPMDVTQERSIIREILYDWNIVNSEKYGMVLNPTGWDISSYPDMGNHPQKILNKQILDKADILIGVFWTRIGTKTESYESGSVEEISKHIERKKTVLLYFSSAPVVPDSIDTEQYKKLVNYKNSIKSQGFFRQYDSIGKFTSMVTKDLALLINDRFSDNVPDSQQTPDTIGIHDEVEKTLDLLNDDMKALLKQSSLDRSGTLLRMHTLGGFSIQTNGQAFGSNKRNDPKMAALLEEVIGRLEELGLIHATTYKRDVFTVTAEGYRIAERIENIDE